MPQDEEKLVSDSVLRTTYIVTNSDLNPRGVLYGGRAVAIIDALAAGVAKDHAGGECVTASIDSVHFLSPVLVDETLIIRAAVNRAWNTSMEVGVKLLVRRKGGMVHVTSAYFTFVAVDTDGMPRGVPLVVPTTRNEKRRFRKAAERRKVRLAGRS